MLVLFIYFTVANSPEYKAQLLTQETERHVMTENRMKKKTKTKEKRSKMCSPKAKEFVATRRQRKLVGDG